MKFKVCILLFLIFNVYFAKSQVGITTYSFESLGFNTSSKSIISADIKIFANREYEFMIFDFSCLYNFKQKTYHRFSVGAGLSIEPFRENDNFRAFIFPLVLEIKPLQDFKRLSFIIELTPRFGFDTNSESDLRHLWGIRYTFGD